MTDAFSPFVPAYHADPTVRRLWRALTDRAPAIVIVGTSGMGKSLLCDCVSDAAEEMSRPVRAFSANAFVKLAMETKCDDVQYIFSRTSVVIVDDVHQVLAAPAASTLLAVTFAFLVKRQGTVVVSSDRGPGVLSACASAAKTELYRALGGATAVYIDQPGFAARREIVLRRCADWRSARRPVDIPEDIADILAGPEVSPRTLIASVDRVATYADITHAAVTAETIEIANALTIPVARPTVAAIQIKTAEYFDIDPREMTSPNRCRRFARPRQVAMYLSRKLTALSLPEIGSHFGHRDHTTVIAAIKRIEMESAASPNFARQVEFLANAFTTPAAALPTPTRRGATCAGSHPSGAPSC